ncbi:hypothetical protein FRC00_003976 [Tulasnella sp. 408]|nr:hypothetical protein FRC00_003976 [Tulasnella sp. 408]
MDTAKTNNAERENAQGAATDLKASMKALMANALLLQTRDTADIGKPALEVRSRLKKHLQDERFASHLALPGLHLTHVARSVEFTLFPVSAMCSTNAIMDRYLLIWCSTSEGRCITQPFDLTQRARQAIHDASKAQLLEYSVDKVKERGRDRLIVLATESSRNSQSERDGYLLHATILKAAQGVWGQPALAEATQPRPALTSAQLDTAQPAYRGGITNKENKRQYDEDKQQAGDDGEPMAPRKRARRAKGSKEDDSLKAEMEGLKWVVGLLPRAGDKKGEYLTEESKSGTPPAPEAPEPENAPSPLDYTTEVGNAWVVHRIYSEARRATRPRTAAEERSRRKRALQMAFKEIIGVIKDIEWYRGGMGFKSGPQPSVLIGLEDVPEQEQRAWLLKKLDALKERQCQVRCAVAENRAARLHIIAVIDAVLDTRRAGAEGIVF